MRAPWLALATAAACEGPAAPPPPPATRFAMETPGPVEIWRAEDGGAVEFRRKKRRLVHSDGRRAAGAVKWSGWDVLTACLGRPLADPPGAARRLIWAASPRWEIVYDGANACGVTGMVALSAGGGRVDASELYVEGLAWGDGGRERAAELTMGIAQANAVMWWLEGDPAARSMLLLALRRSPDPASEDALRRILEVAGPGERAAVEEALADRPVTGPRAP